mmetsp:Transcript_8783/g.13107  ORF Transcript_8783/g.13107 Transcript_8783/m.13107 type:complete len:288 (-) Transcript_8783:375-1238(-)
MDWKSDSTLLVQSVSDVQMMRGWTMDVIFLGNLAPKVKVVNVVKSMKSAWMGVLSSGDKLDDGYDVSIVAAADRIVPMNSPWNVLSENALGAGAVVAAATGWSDTAVAAGVDVDDGKSFRTPITEYAVENKVKKNPQIMTAATFKISALEPRLCANGKVTNDGTKNTGNHFANTSLPGDNKSYAPSPKLGLKVYRLSNVMKMTPQPPRDDGKDVIPRYLNDLRKKMSSAMKDSVDRIDVTVDGFVTSLGGCDEKDASADDVADDSWVLLAVVLVLVLNFIFAMSCRQ